jgi:hypothetical protein
MSCNFRPWQNDLFKCENCGYVTKYGSAHRECVYIHQPQYEPSGPSLTRRIINFAKSAINHELAGRPIVSEEVLKSRLSICNLCPSNLFKRISPTEGLCTHETCGCNITDHQTYLNKVAWADQQCPMGHWLMESGKKP